MQASSQDGQIVAAVQMPGDGQCGRRGIEDDGLAVEHARRGRRPDALLLGDVQVLPNHVGKRRGVLRSQERSSVRPDEPPRLLQPLEIIARCDLRDIQRGADLGH